MQALSLNEVLLNIIHIKKKHSVFMVYINVFKMSFLEPAASESPEKLKKKQIVGSHPWRTESHTEAGTQQFVFP